MNALRSLEQSVLAEGREWTRRRLERRLQAELHALPPTCLQTGQPLTDTRWRPLQLHTVAGVVQVRVRHGHSAALGRRVCPAREAWGVTPWQRLSPEFEARLTYTATEVGSYERAARMAGTWGSPSSDGCIHEHAQRLARIFHSRARKGNLGRKFQAGNSASAIVRSELRSAKRPRPPKAGWGGFLPPRGHTAALTEH